MRIINLNIALILSLLSFTATGQFKIKTEYEYLKLINNQQNKILIKDNLKNADDIVARIIASENEPYSSYYIVELARGYNLIGQKELAFFYLLVQRNLFPNDTLSYIQKNKFHEFALSLNLNEDTAKDYWSKTLPKNIPENFSDRIVKLLTLSTELHSSKLTEHIYNTGLFLRSKNAKIPVWYQHWEYLTIIGVNEKLKQKIIHSGKYTNQSIFNLIKKNKYKKKVYRKAIKHYTKAGAKTYAKNLISDYESLDLSIFEKFDLLFKKAKIIF